MGWGGVVAAMGTERATVREVWPPRALWDCSLWPQNSASMGEEWELAGGPGLPLGGGVALAMSLPA